MDTRSEKRPHGLGAERVRDLPKTSLMTLLRDGMDAAEVDLATGTPWAPRPSEALVEAACDALRSGVHQYLDPAGDIELRTQIGQRLRTPAEASEITVTTGATEAVSVALLATINPGDEVVLFEPFFDNFLGAIAMCGGRPRLVRMRSPDWSLDRGELVKAFGPRTKAILLNSPNNPTGKILDKDELAEISALCAKWNVTVISDEVYSAYVFDGRAHLSAADVPELRERSIVVGSFSKSHAISGWRLGFLRAPGHYTTTLREVHIAMTGGAAAPLQRAVAASGIIEAGFWDPSRELQELRDLTVSIFTRAGLICPKPEGGCYIFADLRALTEDDCETYAKALARDTGVLTAPGSLFFRDSAAGRRFVRIAFNRPRELLENVARLIDRAQVRAELRTA